MREGVLDRVAEDLRRFRVYRLGYGYEIRDAKHGNYEKVRDATGKPRFFHNRGRAQKIADKLEAENKPE